MKHSLERPGNLVGRKNIRAAIHTNTISRAFRAAAIGTVSGGKLEKFRQEELLVKTPMIGEEMVTRDLIDFSGGPTNNIGLYEQPSARETYSLSQDRAVAKQLKVSMSCVRT